MTRCMTMKARMSKPLAVRAICSPFDHGRALSAVSLITGMVLVATLECQSRFPCRPADRATHQV
jgi:hypothetical protein